MSDVEERLSKIEETVEENHKILKRLQRSARAARFWHFLKWMVIIIGALVGYYFLQPYIETTREVWQQIKGTAGQFGGFLGN